ncbi:MAG: hypothetical protein ABEI13_03645 [Candidatus Paceibacteria bacterium]
MPRKTRPEKMIQAFYHFFLPFLSLHEHLHVAAAKLLRVQVRDIVYEDKALRVDFVKDLHDIKAWKLIIINLAPITLIGLGYFALELIQYVNIWVIQALFVYICVGAYIFSRPSTGDLISTFLSFIGTDKKIRYEPIGFSISFILFIVGIPLFIAEIIDFRTGLIFDLLFVHILSSTVYTIPFHTVI